MRVNAHIHVFFVQSGMLIVYSLIYYKCSLLAVVFGL